MYIDSHCHLFYDDFTVDLADVLARAEAAGVTKCVVPATNYKTALQSLALADRYPALSVSIGFHPLDLEHFCEEDFEKLKKLATHPKVVAIGEIGLDYFYDTSPREYQKEIFIRQIEFAVQKDLPIIVHTRDSMEDAIEIVTGIAREHGQWKREGIRGVFHCFTGSAEQANILIENRFYVSFPGPITFKKNEVMAKTVKAIGIEHIMLETDAPFLTPVPFRGKRNEPSYIPLIAQKISEITGVSAEEIARQTTANAKRLFTLR